MVELKTAQPADRGTFGKGSPTSGQSPANDEDCPLHKSPMDDHSDANNDTTDPSPETDPAPETGTGGALARLDNRRLLMVGAASLLGLFLLATLYTLYYVQAVLFPITLAVILKLIFGPVVRRLNKWHLPNFVGAAVVVSGMCGFTITGIALLSGPASEWIDDAPRHFRSVEYKLWSIKDPIEKVTDVGKQVEKLTNIDDESSQSVEVKQPGIMATATNTTAEVAVGIFLTLVLLYFLLAGGDRFLEKLVELTPDWRSKRSVVQMARDVQQSMSSYLFATTCINIGLGIAIGVGMWLAGLPNPVLWGVMAGCLNFIPYFGCIIGALIVFLVGLTSLDSAAQALWAPLIYISINAVEGYFITPAVLGRSISLSPLAILISMILWGWIWDIPGMLIAVPILAATKIACDHIQPLQPLGKLLGR